MNKYYITTSIAYLTGEPHVGYGQELLAADVLRRYYELRGVKSYWQTGTDEHGASVLAKAKEVGKAPSIYVDGEVAKFYKLCEDLNLKYDGFVRTTDLDHIKNAQEIWMKAYEAGYIYKKHYSGVYCVGCEAMKTKSELVEGKCPNHSQLEPEVIEEENWFFKLSQFQDRLLDWYEKNPKFVQPDFRFNEIKSLVENGLEDVSISRSREKLPWGILVPNDDSHVMYVWFDALTNYLYPGEQWRPADLHIIGKDILRFHAALWPAMLWAAGYSDDELPAKIHAHGFISVEGQKMSKSLGNVVRPSDLIEKFGVEATRYLLLKELSFSQDSDFSWEKMAQRYNADLANDLGNLLQRTLAMINKYGVKVELPDILFIDKKFDNNDRYLDFLQLADVLAGTLRDRYDDFVKRLDFSEALYEVQKIISAGNRYIQENQPWELAKSDTKKLGEVLNTVYEALWCTSELIAPFIPETSKKMKKQLEELKPEPLFPRVAS